MRLLLLQIVKESSGSENVPIPDWVSVAAVGAVSVENRPSTRGLAAFNRLEIASCIMWACLTFNDRR